MTDAPREQLTIDTLPGYEPELGLLLGMLEDTRRRTKAMLAGIGDADLDWSPGPGFNSIATVLYHLALIEADWLYAEILEQDYPPAALALFPRAVRDDADLLMVAGGETLKQLVVRLDAVRALLLAALRDMPAADLRRARVLPDYDVTPQYIFHHLMQHEAEHRSEIGMLRALAAQARGASSAE